MMTSAHTQAPFLFPTRDDAQAADNDIERRVDEILDSRAGVKVDSERHIAVVGGSFDPPHWAHLQMVLDLEAKGYEVWIVPSMGHVYKLHTAGSYLVREAMATLAFGKRVRPIEREIWHRVGLPIYTYDILAEVRRRVGPGVKISAIHGPDIDPKTWQGYPQINAAGFKFLPVDPIIAGGAVRSTVIRQLVASGAPRSEWGGFVPEIVGDFIVRHGLYTGVVPERPDLTYLA